MEGRSPTRFGAGESQWWARLWSRVYRPRYQLLRVLLWGRNRLWRKLSLTGKTLFIALLVLGMLSGDPDDTIAYQGGVLLFVFLATAALFQFWPFRMRFTAVRQLPRFGSVGQSLSYTLLVRNLDPKPQAGLVVMDELKEEVPSFEDWLRWQRALTRRARSLRLDWIGAGRVFRAPEPCEAPLPVLLPGQEKAVALEILPRRRGLLRFAQVSVVRTDPLGLLRTFRRRPLVQTLTVLPRRYRLPPKAFLGTRRSDQGDFSLAASIGQSEEFVSLRDYRAGDPLRHIHWRSWARVGKPVVREFEEQSCARHALVLDTFWEEPESAAFEEAVSVAASFACTVETQESLLDLLFVGAEAYCFTAGRDQGKPDQMLEILASVRPCPEGQFAALEQRVLDHAPVLSGCVCVFLHWDRQRQDFVRKLLALQLPVRVLVISEAAAAQLSDPGPLSAQPDHFQLLRPGRVEQDLMEMKP